MDDRILFPAGKITATDHICSSISTRDCPTVLSVIPGDIADFGCVAILGGAPLQRCDDGLILNRL